MSEVLKWMALGEMAQRSRIGGGAYVLLADFDALRIEAERQVGELREQLVDLSSLNRELEHKMDYFKGFETHNKALQAKLATAMGLLRSCNRLLSLAAEGGVLDGMQDSSKRHWYYGEIKPTRDAIRALINTTSTEGKDHA